LAALPLAALVGSAFGTAEDEAPLQLVQTIVLKGKSGKLDHVALDAKRDRLFVANKVNNTLDLVDLKAGKLMQQVPGQQGVQGIAYVPELDRVFVALGDGGDCNVFDCSVFDGKKRKLLKSINLKNDADNVRFDPRSGLVYVAHADKALAAIDAKSFELKTDISLPGAAEGFEVESKRPRMYLNAPPDALVVIDTEKNEVAQTHKLTKAAQNVPLALDEANHRLFIGCRKPAMLVVVDSESGKEVAATEIPGGVDDVSFDAKRKLVYASCGEGYLAVIKQQDPDTYAVAAKLETAKDAKTSYFDADTGRLFVAVPRQEGKAGPEIRIYQAR
jgi:DNA-binding beta-propeller fold protein YncE